MTHPRLCSSVPANTENELEPHRWSRKDVHDRSGPQRTQYALVIWNRVKARAHAVPVAKMFHITPAYTAKSQNNLQSKVYTVNQAFEDGK